MTGVGRTYPLPSNGWRPGGATPLAGVHGPFHAVSTPCGADAWLGTERTPMTWPHGWSVRLDPVELVDPSGALFVKEGQMLSAGGGLNQYLTFSIGPLDRDDADKFLARIAHLQERQRAQGPNPAPAARRRRREYALPGNGRQPGDTGGRRARHAGRLGVGVDAGTARLLAWIGQTGDRHVWPEGWRLRLDPVELINPDGRVFAHEGDELELSGGYESHELTRRHLGNVDRTAWSINTVKRLDRKSAITWPIDEILR